MNGVKQIPGRSRKTARQVAATGGGKDEIDWEKRDHIGLYPQKQPV